MRTISSFTLVGTLFPPWKTGLPLPFTALLAGKMPAASRAVELGSIMQLGIVLLGNGDPCTIPAGATPPGQFLNKNAGVTFAALGTLGAGPPATSAPFALGYHAVLGTVWFSVWPWISLRHSML